MFVACECGVNCTGIPDPPWDAAARFVIRAAAGLAYSSAVSLRVAAERPSTRATHLGSSTTAL
jgi:hypothetical protein